MDTKLNSMSGKTVQSSASSLYKRCRVDYTPEFANLRKSNKKVGERLTHGFMPALIFAVLFWGIIFIACQFALDYIATANAASEPSQFELYVTSGIFKDTGENTAYVRDLEDKIKKLLGVVLPTMSLVSITLVMLSLISTVLYLFKQEYFDEVYMAKKQLKDNKARFFNFGGGGKNPINPQFFSNSAVQDHGLIKCYLMPNLKAWAFYEATDGRMTIVDFLKKNALKCIMMFSFCILISDQTMLELFLKGASVGTYVFKRAAEVDYVTMIDNFVTTGTDYTPYYDTSETDSYNRLQTFKEGYRVLKSLCDPNNSYQRTTDFKTMMGQRLVDFIDNEMVGTVPFEREIFSVRAEAIDYSSYQKAVSVTGNTSSSYAMSTDKIFTADDGVEQSYIRFFFVTKDDARHEDGAVTTTSDIGAWAGNPESVVTWDYASINIDTSDPSTALQIDTIASIMVERYATLQPNKSEKSPVEFVATQMYNGSDYAQSGGWTSSVVTPLTPNVTLAKIATENQGHTVNNDASKGISGNPRNGLKFDIQGLNTSTAKTADGEEGTVTFGSIRSISINGIQYRTGNTNGLSSTKKSQTRSTYYNGVKSSGTSGTATNATK